MLSSNTYDNKGRITFNDQIGTVGFNIGGNPYRASQMTLNSQGIFNYDLNGQSKLVQKITYNENNDPIKIDGTHNDYSFQYGLTESRQIMHYGGNFASNANSKYTKFYSEDGTFEIIRNNATGQEKHVIYVGGNAYNSNITFIKNYNESTGSYKFLHKDYLGSILAVSDEAGNAVERRHFDAWGNFTHLQKNNGAVLTDINAINASYMMVDRGYTSHEYLAGVELIHMNGRLYDPLLRRFLNADENIQDPYNAQNYNKYGYVMNNPLMYNDPSGEFFWLPLAIGALIGGIQNGISSMKNGGTFLGGFWKGAIVGAGSAYFAMGMPIGVIPGFIFGATTGTFFGALSAALNGQNVSSAGLMGGLIGGITGGISGGIKAYRAGVNVWTGTGTAKQLVTIEDLNLPNKGNEANFQTTTEMYDYYNENIVKVDGISLEQVKDKIGAKNISLASIDSSLPEGMGVDLDGILYVDGKRALGVNYGYYKNGFSVGKSSILIAPATKSYGVLGANLVFKHEFMHAWHWNILPSSSNQKLYSERATSTFTVAYIKAHGLQKSMNAVLRGGYMNLAPPDSNIFHKLFNTVYPSFMSWRKFNSVIPTWIN